MVDDGLTLGNDIKSFRKKPNFVEIFKVITDGLFRKIMAILIVYGAGNFLFNVATQEGSTVQEMVIGYIFGVITTVLSYYYGTSQSSQDKEKRLEEERL